MPGAAATSSLRASRETVRLRTEWSTQDIRLRREFNLDSKTALKNVGSLALRFHHDDAAEVYLNDVPAALLPRWLTSYTEVNVSAGAARPLQPGRNLLAIHCRQNNGSQCILTRG